MRAAVAVINGNRMPYSELSQKLSKAFKSATTSLGAAVGSVVCQTQGVRFSSIVTPRTANRTGALAGALRNVGRRDDDPKSPVKGWPRDCAPHHAFTRAKVFEKDSEFPGVKRRVDQFESGAVA